MIDGDDLLRNKSRGEPQLRLRLKRGNPFYKSQVTRKLFDIEIATK